MTIKENKQVVTATLAALAAGNYEEMLEHLADDIQFYVIGTTNYSGMYKGKKELLEKILLPMGEQRNEDGFSEEIINIVGESDYVVSESRGKKTTRDGSQYYNEYLFIYRLEDSKIKEWRCYLDTQLLSDTHT